jgi:antitoxin CptB
MSGTVRSSDGLPVERKRALFHAWHRGTREMDLLLGTFADAHLADLSDSDFEAFVQLMDERDDDLLGWLIGRDEPPADVDTGLFRAIKTFHAAPGGITR